MKKADFEKYGKAPKPEEIKILDTTPTVEELKYYRDSWYADARTAGIPEILFDAGELWAEKPTRHPNKKWISYWERREIRWQIGKGFSAHYFDRLSVTTRSGLRAPAIAKIILVMKGGKPPFEFSGVAGERGERIATFLKAEITTAGFGYEEIATEWENEGFCIPGEWMDLLYAWKIKIQEEKDLRNVKSHDQERRDLINQLNLRGRRS